MVVYDQFFDYTLIKSICPQAKILIPWSSGESTKSIASYSELIGVLASYVDRCTILIAVGGGTIGDVCGFVAATLLRGIDWVFVPTTLLSQVDSSIGGKTGINHGHIKNMVGCFYPPKITLCNVDFLKTLPLNQIKSGYVELMKHGLICDQVLFDDMCQLFQKESDFYDNFKFEPLIKRSIQLKLNIIGDDFLEKNPSNRIFLNLGHTFGHAIETLSNFDIPHGISVGMGIIIAYRYALLERLVPNESLKKIIDHFNNVSLPTSCAFNFQDMLFVMSHDKKKTSDGIRIILPKGIGQGCVATILDSEILEKAMLSIKL